MGLAVTWRAHGTAKGISGHHNPRQLHCLTNMLEGVAHDDDGWSSCFFKGSCEVSDRHVTDRSDRYEQDDVSLKILDPLHPLWKELFEPEMRGRARERQEVLGE